MHKRVVPIALATIVCALAVAVASAMAADNHPTPKAIFEQQAAKERAAALAGPRAAKQVLNDLTPGAKPERQPGILNIRQGPVPAAEFLVVNSWQGPVASGPTWYVVWAGSTGSNSAAPGSPGVILHLQQPTADGYSFTDTPVGILLDSNADGPLSIVAVSGLVITLTTTSGHSYHFNLGPHQFD